ncbi:Gfo/Idh/MocA family oxidoreductase [Paenibacillus sp. ISL-20]|nr:Gfo/Idh/MocA family oxidoreductase [Paenibacillus sp. ISL-20]
MLQVLVIGAGAMGRTHAAAYAFMPGVKLAGIADIRVEEAQQS